MDTSARRPGSVALLIGLVLLVTVAGVLCLVPVIPCPCTTASGRLKLLPDCEGEEAKARLQGKPVLASPVCMRCKDTRKLTLPRKLNYWLCGQ